MINKQGWTTCLKLKGADFWVPSFAVLELGQEGHFTQMFIRSHLEGNNVSVTDNVCDNLILTIFKCLYFYIFVLGVSNVSTLGITLMMPIVTMLLM
jgi:hypothetical protein